MKTLLLETRGDVLHVTLNRPEVRNAFDETLVAELTLAFQGADARAVVLAGAGKAFCAGADVDAMRRSVERTEEGNREDAEALAAMFRAVNECPCPVVGRVQGAAMGGGLGLVAACDVVVAAADVKLAFSEVRLGIVPAVISVLVLPKIGEAAARRWFLTGETFGAAEAQRMGLVHEVAEPEALDGAVEKVLGAFRGAGPAASREAKALIRAVQALPRDAATAHATATIARVRTSPEGQEGLRAFLEKRPAAFTDGGRG